VLVGVLLGIAGVAFCEGAVVSASALPSGRSYEMVSPLFKGGQGVSNIRAVAPDGESAAYYSPGVFAGSPSTPPFGPSAPPYLARRGASGWSTTSLTAPLALVHGRAGDLSPDLGLEFVSGPPGPDAQNEFLQTENLFLHATSLPDAIETWQSTGEIKVPAGEISIEYQGASPDFCHVLFYTGAALVAEAEGTGNNEFYEFDRGCSGEPASLKLLGVNNRGKIINRECKVNIGVQAYGSGSEFNAVSGDGGEIFFTDCPSGATSPGAPGSGVPHQLFVRLGGSRTLEVSRPLEAGKQFGGCVGEEAPKAAGEVSCEGALTRPSADFVGASQDGSEIYFTTTASLTASDKDVSGDLYMATIGCPQAKPGCVVAEREVTSLTQVSHDPNAAAAEVQGVLRVAPDGQRAYFVAGGDLLGSAQRQTLEGEGRSVPVVGGANLYVFDSAASGTIEFIGALCTGKQESGTAEDIHCPSAESDVSLWASVAAQSGGESQTAGLDGRFLVFATYAQLTDDDTNRVKDVYRYDAENGELERVSVGVDGYDANGNGERTPLGQLPGARIAQGHHGGESVLEEYEMNNRDISEDGSRIVFTSAEPLSSAATNGVVNAYEWHTGSKDGDGSVALVSTGSDEEPIKEVVISPDGSSVFFVTVQGLVPQDTDGLPDIYDARLGGGFPPQPAERRPCEGDGCQGPLTNPAPLLVPGSVTQAPGGNLLAPAAAVKPKSKPKPACKRGYKFDKHGKCVKVKRKARKVTAHLHGRSSNRGEAS
jgi:hypothetical protein